MEVKGQGAFWLTNKARYEEMLSQMTSGGID
jgi:hypothetical protein